MMIRRGKKEADARQRVVAVAYKVYQKLQGCIQHLGQQYKSNSAAEYQYLYAPKIQIYPREQYAYRD